MMEIRFRRDLEPGSTGEHRNLAGAARLSLEHAINRAELPGLAKQESREQFEIEADLSDPLLRNGRIEVDAYADRLTLRARAHGVVEPEVRVDDGIEALAITLRI